MNHLLYTCSIDPFKVGILHYYLSLHCARIGLRGASWMKRRTTGVKNDYTILEGSVESKTEEEHQVDLQRGYSHRTFSPTTEHPMPDKDDKEERSGAAEGNTCSSGRTSGALAPTGHLAYTRNPAYIQCVPDIRYHTWIECSAEVNLKK